MSSILLYSILISAHLNTSPNRAERERVPETFNPHANSANTVPANDCHQTLAVSVALAAVPLGAIAYYDPKIAVTTLVILFVLSVVRRIFAMIADAEKNI